jgi:succinyl-CoA synthetase beta subunit
MKLAKKIFETALSEGRTFVLEHEAKDIMKAYGIPIPKYSTAATADDAVKEAEAIGYPVVLKILSKDVLHKSDAGGVKLNLKNEEDVRKAFDEIMENAKKYGVQLHYLSNEFSADKSTFGHVLDLQLKVTGSFHRTMKFINSLEQSFLVVDIHNVDLTAASKIDSELKISVWGITY